MKWFKHETKRKAALKRLIMEYGIEGYGLYWLCIELISGDITIKNLTFELEEDAELIAHEFRMDTIKVEKIMHRCIELGLFDLADSGRVRCLELAHMMDESISKNPHVKELKVKISEKLQKYSNSGNTPESIPTPSNQNRVDKNRVDKNRIDKNNIYINDLIDYWNTKEIIKHKHEVVNHYIQKKHRDVIELFGLDVIKKSIDNYSTVLKENEYYFDHKWSMWDFIQRGVKLFIDDASPLENFKNKYNNPKQQQKSARELEIAESNRIKMEEYDRKMEQRRVEK